MSKKPTKRDLEDRIQQLEDLLASAGVEIHPAHLMGQIEETEAEYRREIEHLHRTHIERVQQLVDECEGITGRIFSARDSEVGKIISQEDCVTPSGGVMLSVEMESCCCPKSYEYKCMDSEDGIKSTLRRIGYDANPKHKQGYAFESLALFRDWAMHVLREGWHAKNRA